MKSLGPIVALYVTIVHFVNGAQLPSSFHRCKWRDPNFDACLKEAIEDALRQLKKAAPEIKLASLEPIKATELTIGEGKGPVNVITHYTNAEITGLSDAKVLEVKTDIPHSLDVALLVPEFVLKADYKLNGRVLMLPVVGEGTCVVKLTNVAGNATTKLETYEEGGKKYARFTEFKVSLTPEQVHFAFDNLFDGDVRLGAELNKVLNDNWDAVFSDVHDQYEQAFGLIGLSVANSVFSRVALPDVFPGYDG